MKHLSRLLAALVILTFYACTNDSEPAQEQQLVVTSTNPDSVVNPAMPITFDLVVRANNNPIEGAQVIVTKPNGQDDTMTTKTGADGHVIYTEASFSGVLNHWNIYSFRAFKEGSKTSTRYTRHVRVLPRLMLAVVDTVEVIGGQTANITLTVTEPSSTPTLNAAVKIENAFGNVVAEPLTDQNGEVTFTVPTNPQDIGTQSFKATASKINFANSETHHFAIKIVRNPPQPPSVFYFNSLSSHSIGVKWDPVDDDKAVYHLKAYQEGSAVVFSKSTQGIEAILDDPSLSGITYVGISVNGGPEGPRRPWATAKRLPFEVNGQQTVRLWETAAPASKGGAGLIVSPTGLRSVDISSPESSMVDVVLATFPDSPELPLMLVAPGVDGSGITKGKNTLFASLATEFLGTLDDDYYQESLEALIPKPQEAYNTLFIANRTAPNPQLSVILPLVFDHSGGHYGRIEIAPQSDGQLYGKEDDYHFIDVRISYQELAETPYAGRPRAQQPNRPRRAVKLVRK